MSDNYSPSYSTDPKVAESYAQLPAFEDLSISELFEVYSAHQLQLNRFDRELRNDLSVEGTEETPSQAELLAKRETIKLLSGELERIHSRIQGLMAEGKGL